MSDQEYARELPHDLAAEEYALGAIMLTESAGTAVRNILAPRDFYRESHGIIYKAALALLDLNIPVDPVTLAARLEAENQIERVGGRERIRELATIVPAAANAPHYARIVVDLAQLRDLIAVGSRVSQLGWERTDDTTTLREQARDLVAGLRERETNTPLAWQDHQTVLELEISAERYLIEDLIPTGAVGTIAGVPETHKSWLAQAIAVRVARGHGWILGKEVTHQGPVGYLWQDDSTREEAERVKHFEAAHPNPSHLPLIWGLNLGLQLPADLPRIIHAVTTNNLVLLVIDSFYNFLPGIDLKDDQAEQIVARLKRDISDATGCTVLIVDHMPWATETNRGRLRAYGGVFKNAATRYGIYIDATGDKLHIEARGNNITGIPKRLAYWDPDTLELKLLNEDDETPTERKGASQEIADWLNNQPGQQATAAEIAHAFDISTRTLHRRDQTLKTLGVTVTEKRGQPTHYQHRPLTQTPDTTQDTGMTNTLWHTQNGTTKPNDPGQTYTPDKHDLSIPKSADMQGKDTLDKRTPPKGGSDPLSRVAPLPPEPAPWNDIPL